MRGVRISKRLGLLLENLFCEKNDNVDILLKFYKEELDVAMGLGFFFLSDFEG